jgi:hypothetical protein
MAMIIKLIEMYFHIESLGTLSDLTTTQILQSTSTPSSPYAWRHRPTRGHMITNAAARMAGEESQTGSN